MRTIYTWRNQIEPEGKESKFIKEKEAETIAAKEEVKRLERENDYLKKIVAEKELQIRIQNELIKKSKSH